MIPVPQKRQWQSWPSVRGEFQRLACEADRLYPWGRSQEDQSLNFQQSIRIALISFCLSGKRQTWQGQGQRPSKRIHLVETTIENIGVGSD